MPDVRLAPSYEVAICDMQPSGPLVRLSDVLDDLATDVIEWRLLEIEATSDSGDLDVTELQRRALAAPEGLTFSASDIADLACALAQTINLDALGFTSDATLAIRLQARDSGDWLLAYAPAQVHLGGRLPWSVTSVAVTDPRALLAPH